MEKEHDAHRAHTSNENEGIRQRDKDIRQIDTLKKKKKRPTAR